MPLPPSLIGHAARLALGGCALVQSPRLSILIFHRVLPEPDPIFPHEVDAERFDALMGVVARSFRVMALSEAVDGLANDRLPPRALCITFDDGYEDNHDIALPILQRHRLPACFFIATGFMHGGLMFNDAVIECVRRSPLQVLDLADLGLGALPIASPRDKKAAIGKILDDIKYRALDDRPAAVQRLRQAAQPAHMPERLMMAPHKVRQMRRAGMEIGVHTVHHPILARLDDGSAEAELRDCRQTLEGLLDEPVNLLAYPNGVPDRDYDRRHVAIARRLGFKAAVTTAPGVSRPGDDLLQLPRFTPWDMDLARWTTRLLLQRRGTRFQRAALPA